MKRLFLTLTLAVLVASGYAQSKNINMKAKSKTGQQVTVPTAGKKTDAIMGQTTMLVDGKIYPFIGFSYVSCAGDSLTGQVVITVEATAKNDSVRVAFGKGCGENPCVRAVDLRGVLYEGVVAEQPSAEQALATDTPVRYAFAFDGIPVGLDLFHFVKAEYEMHNGDTLVTSQECNPLGVKYARIEWKNGKQ